LNAQTLHPRCPPPQMGGLTGLPRIPTKALKLTKKWNPSCEYSERIATLWRDLETLYGNEEIAGLGGGRTTIEQGRYVDSGISTNKFRGFTYNVDLRVEEVYKVVKRHPSLLNPEVSNRFVFARSKTILVQKLGSQTAALKVMKKDPAILQVGDDLAYLSAAQIRGIANGKDRNAVVGLAVVVAAAYYAYSAGLLPPEASSQIAEVAAQITALVPSSS